MVTMIVGADGLIGQSLQTKISTNTILLDINYKNDFCSRNNKIHFDVSSKSSIEKLVSYLDTHSIYISQLVYLVGEKDKNNIFTCSIEDWDRVLNLNVTSFFKLFKYIYPYCNYNTSIVTLSSQNGIVGHEDRIAYGPSKAAMIQLVKNLTIDLEKYSTKNIRINTVSPSYIFNENDINYFNSYPGSVLKRRIPANELIDINSVTSSILFLLSKDSKSIRGTNLVVDNGYTIK